MLLQFDEDKGHSHPLTSGFLAGRSRHELAGGDLDVLESMVDGLIELNDRQVLVQRGEQLRQAAMLVDGFMLRTIEQDNRRFIVGICVPGDFVDLHGLPLRRLDHNIVAAGKAVLASVPHSRIESAMSQQPQLARALWFASLLDAAIHRKWIQVFEQHDAPRRIAHIYCELRTRLSFVGRCNDGEVRTPFTQYDLADMCGITAVHANRAVSKLREIEVAQIRRGNLYCDDWNRLAKFARFDPAYLFGR